MNRAGFDLWVPKPAHATVLAAGVALVAIALLLAVEGPLTDFSQASVSESAPVRDAEEPATKSAPTPTAKTRCQYCGIIESTRQVGSVHEVTVRLADRTTHVFSDSNPANWRPGQRIILIGGGNSPRN